VIAMDFLVTFFTYKLALFSDELFFLLDGTVLNFISLHFEINLKLQ
jgi:hypothetical protein